MKTNFHSCFHFCAFSFAFKDMILSNKQALVEENELYAPEYVEYDGLPLLRTGVTILTEALGMKFCCRSRD